MKKFLSLVMLGCMFAVSAASVKIASKGKAVSVIVVDADAHRTVKFAAKELQNYFHLIAGAAPDVRNKLPDDGKTSSIILGTADSPLVKKFIGENSAELKYDGYAVAAKGNIVVIYADNPRGVLNGVHRFIMKHTDFIWVRPLKETGP